MRTNNYLNKITLCIKQKAVITTIETVKYLQSMHISETSVSRM